MKIVSSAALDVHLMVLGAPESRAFSKSKRRELNPRRESMQYDRHLLGY